MHPSQRLATAHQHRVGQSVSNADAGAMFNHLTGPQLFDRVEALVPEHRERLFPPTETVAMFVAQVLSADGSCQQAVDDAIVKRLIDGLKSGSTDTRDSYLLELARYVVLNPVRAGMVHQAQEWAWSSYRATAGEVSSPLFLTTDWLLRAFADSRAEAVALPATAASLPKASTRPALGQS
jgi:hypothetical protein